VRGYCENTAASVLFDQLVTIMKTILVASQNRKHHKMFLKVHESVPLHYLEPWSLEELLMAAPKYNLPADAVKERYYILGGVSRLVFVSADRTIGALKDLITNSFQGLNLDQVNTKECSLTLLTA
jgi:hypothetical protein